MTQQTIHTTSPISNAPNSLQESSVKSQRHQRLRIIQSKTKCEEITEIQTGKKRKQRSDLEVHLTNDRVVYSVQRGYGKFSFREISKVLFPWVFPPVIPLPRDYY